jgi:hypothetical protein
MGEHAMKSLRNLVLVSAFAVAVALPADAQTHQASGRSGNNGSSGAASTGSVSASTSSSSSSISYSTTSAGSSSSDYRGASHGFSPNVSNQSGYIAPSPQYSSFTTYNMFWDWQHFFSRLQTEYYLNPAYGHRFMVNREPLLTPSLLRIAVRKPLRLSSTLISKLDDLDAMLLKVRSGENVDKEQITLKIQEIRQIAKKISKSSDWNLIDQRKDKDVLKGMQLKDFSLDDSARLREIAADLHTQLQSWYDSSSTNTISAASLTQASIESLTKGIEKISKAMENTIKHM